MSKDVSEYFEYFRREVADSSCSIEGEAFEREVGADGRETGRGHVSARITFPGYPKAYLNAEEWIQPHRGHFERETYAYDLIFDGARLDNWHRHHGAEHKHDDEKREKRRHKRVTIREVLETCYVVLESSRTPG